MNVLSMKMLQAALFSSEYFGRSCSSWLAGCSAECPLKAGFIASIDFQRVNESGDLIQSLVSSMERVENSCRGLAHTQEIREKEPGIEKGNMECLIQDSTVIHYVIVS